MKHGIKGNRGTTAEVSKRDFLAADTLGAPEYEPRAVRVKAMKMQDAFMVHTMEGRMAGKAGDYLVQGLEGELYPCAADIFERKYKVVK